MRGDMRGRGSVTEFRALRGSREKAVGLVIKKSEDGINHVIRLPSDLFQHLSNSGFVYPLEGRWHRGWRIPEPFFP
jgi:hypothetical protein